MKIARIPAVLALVCVIFSCDILLPPERGRENPLDPDNPVAPVGDFNCVAIDTNSIKLTWTIPGDNVPAGIVIIRKEGSEPASMTDGVELDDAAVILNYGEYTDTGLESNKDYWYAAWTYDDAEEHFTGPVTDKASTKMDLE